MRKLKITASVLLLSLAAVLAAGLLREERPPFPLLDEPAPAFALPSLGGGTFNPAEGEYLIVNFFASWCAPCLVEHPQLAELAGQYPLAGIAYKDDLADLQKWLDEHGNIFADIGLDHSGEAGLAWGLSGVPETFVIDKSGRLRYRHRGPLLATDLPQFRSVVSKMVGKGR